MASTSVLASLDLRPIAGSVGAEVRGLDLREPLTTDVTAAIEAALTAHGVVIFTGQRIGCDEHLTLARALGEIKLPPDYFPQTLRDEGYPEISVISTENGLAYTSDRWHADVTWMPNPPKYSILHMQVLPPAGGDTLWASQHAAYEWLSEPMRRFLDPLTVRHQMPSQPDRYADHPVVCRHPRSGRRALFVNSVFATRINELTEAESANVLAYLFAHSVQPELTCRWRWGAGDVAVWDNHFVQHYAVADYRPAARKIHRIEIQGEAPIPAVG